jgi:hypothetical protein
MGIDTKAMRKTFDRFRIGWAVDGQMLYQWRQLLDEADRLAAENKRLREILDKPCGLAISHDMGCPMMEALRDTLRAAPDAGMSRL